LGQKLYEALLSTQQQHSSCSCCAAAESSTAEVTAAVSQSSSSLKFTSKVGRWRILRWQMEVPNREFKLLSS